MFTRLSLSLITVVALTIGQPARADDSTTPTTADALRWSLDTPRGETISFPHAHEGPVILLFWASWCPFCKALMPHLQSLGYEYPTDELSIYAISIRDDGDPLAFMQAQGYDFTLLFDGDDVAAAYGVHATPGLLIFDRDNRLVLNLYDVMERYNREFRLPDGLGNRQKAARK
ncbi:MAG: TlpA disulfide reductase family protein, partial [Woeseiaceae bacterium]